MPQMAKSNIVPLHVTDHKNWLCRITTSLIIAPPWSRNVLVKTADRSTSLTPSSDRQYCSLCTISSGATPTPPPKA